MKLEHITVFVVAMAMGTSADTNNKTVSPNICDDARVDAAVSDSHFSYIFRGDHFWKLDVDEIVQDHGLFRDEWANAPPNIDAAAFHPVGKYMFLFSGDRYGKYSESKVLEKGYPKLISEGFPGVPDNLDAAIIWPSNKSFYFFKGSKYWRRDYELRESSSDLGPLWISGNGHWPGMPPSIDAILMFQNQLVYFFKDDMYYLFDTTKNEVPRNYPRPTLDYWFKC